MSAKRFSSGPRIGIGYAPGTNCHEETAFAVDLAGGVGEIVLVHDLLAGKASLFDYQGFIIPGGFSWGDHIAAGRVFAVHLVARMAPVHHDRWSVSGLGDQFREFARRRPVLGICNGYQVLMEMGLLPEGTLGERRGALAQNRSARFESRWVRLRTADGDTFWTVELAGRTLRLPVAHAEGRLVLRSGTSVRPAFVYADESGQPTEEYPANPAGSPKGMAGIVDASGLVLGLMPHPERAVLDAHGSTDGLALFRNLVRRCAAN